MTRLGSSWAKIDSSRLNSNTLDGASTETLNNVAKNLDDVVIVMSR